MDKILGHLEAKEHLQAIVLEMLDKGTLQAEQPAVAEDEVPPSTNKYRLVEWPALRDALCQTLPHVAEWLQSLKVKRQFCNTLFAVLTGISKDLALPSKKIHPIEAEIKEKTPAWAKALRLPRAGLSLDDFLLQFPLFSASDRQIKHISGVAKALPAELASIQDLRCNNSSDWLTAEVGKGLLWVKVAALFDDRQDLAPFRTRIERCLDLIGN